MLYYTLDLSVLAIAAIIINVIPDYLSLLETRYILRWMARSKSILRMLGWLLLDAGLPTGIFLAATLVFLLIGPNSEYSWWAWSKLLLVLPDLFQLKGEESGIYGIFLWSTFFTSVWV